MKLPIQKKWWIIVGVVIVGITLFFLLPKNKIVETAKRQLAATFVYEYIPNQQIDVHSTIAFLKKDSIYQDFRKKYRFHYQTIGVGDCADSSKVLLIAEPPPHVEIDSIVAILSKFTHQIEVKQHRIGYDGKVTDLLIVLANATNQNLKNIVKKLSTVLFFSDYKPYHIALPVEEGKVYFSKNNLDLQISLSEFDEWFLQEKELFFTLEDTNTTFDITTLLHEKKKGVYFSQLPGFVAWVIDKTTDFASQIQYIHSFTLDADLVLGGFADSTTLIVIGRERETPIHELPPLRIETILLLASITDKELSQSLDVNDFLAGKMSDGKDWCPTYLSKELENTEFGHLMTITDVLLKNWSESGTIQEAFYRYPSPGYYPFDQPLFKKLGLSELVYNWNTTNAMYAIDLEDVTIYSLNRTGSLPVSYFNSPERSTSVGSKYENQAYNYFARLSNTDLIRVVQYTALYQMFIDNDIHYSGETYTAFPQQKPYLLLSPTKSLLNILKSITDEQVNFIADSVARKHFIEIQKEKVVTQMAKDEAHYQFQFSNEEQQTIFKNVVSQQKQEIYQHFYRIRNMLQNLSEEKFEQLAKYLAYPRGTKVYNQESYQIMLRAKEVNRLMRTFGKNNLPLLGFDLKVVKDNFVNNLGKSGAKYLKTPSVIVTFNDFYTTGGHNLSSKISRVNRTTNYKKTPSTMPTATVQPSEETPISPPVETKSSPSQPATKPSSSQRPPTSTPTPKPSSTPKATATKSSTPTSVKSIASGRARADVIPTTSRTQRGF